MPARDSLRTHILTLLDGKGAHLPFEDATEGLPTELRGKRPAGGSSEDGPEAHPKSTSSRAVGALPYSPWELVEHVRLAQRDILDYCRDGDYAQPDWPDGYWPPTPAPPSADAWDASRAQFSEDRQALQQIIREAEDLHAPVPHATEEAHTYLREALLATGHTSYHAGQLVVVRRLLGCWPPE